MLYIRQGATHKVVIGPVVAVGDGFTPITNLDVATSDEAEVILHDNGTVVDISGYTWAAIATADAYYHLTLQAAISGTVGHMVVVINDDSLCLPVRADFMVIEEAVYDAMYKATATGPQVLAAGAITDASLAGNMEIVFETDFGTNYNTTRNAWATNAQDFVGTTASDPFAGKVVAASVTAGVTLANGAITDASLAGNMEIVFETDFGTNYNTTRNAWATNAQDFVGTTASDPFAGKIVAASVTAGVTLANGAVTDASLAGNMEIVFETDFGTNYNTTRNAWVTNHTDYIGAIPAAALGADCITAAKIADDALVAANFATGCLTADAFAADALVAATFKASSLDGKGDWNTVVPATKAEMDTAHGLLATVAKQDVIKAVTDALTAAAAAKMALSAGTMVTGTVSWDNTNASTTIFYADDIAEATEDHYNGRYVFFTSGALVGQATDITDYALVSSEGKFTVTALTEAPADNVTFIII